MSGRRGRRRSRSPSSSTRARYAAAADDISATTASTTPGCFLFVTVGTTQFDALIDEVVDLGGAALRQLGYKNVVLQIGRGSPTSLFERGLAQHLANTASVSDNNDAAADWRFALDGIDVTVFRFKASITEYIRNAGAIVSHAGAGSIFEALRLRPRVPLVVVSNPLLSEDHQSELASQMAADSFVVHAHLRGASLAAALRTAQTRAFATLPSPQTDAFVAALDRVMWPR